MTPLLPRRVPLLAIVAASAIGLAACGGSDNGSSSSSGSSTSAAKSAPAPASNSGGGRGSGEKLALDANENGGLSFTKKTLNTKAGSVTITMANPKGDQFPHAIAVEGNGVDKDGAIAQPGSDSTITVSLKPGKYEFYCPVGNHRQQGMEGTLTVE